MPYTPHEEQPILFADIERLGCSRKTIARLCDHQENVLTRALAGTRDIPWPEFKVIRQVVNDLLEIKHRFPDVPIDWSDVASLRKLIADLHAEKANPPQPLSRQDADLLHSFARGEPLDDLAAAHCLTREEFLEHINLLLGRASRLAEVAVKQ